GVRAVAARPAQHGADAAAAAGAPDPQGSPGRPVEPGTSDPRADRRGADEPPDRRAPVPGREDGEELRLEPLRQARHAPPYAGGRVRGPVEGGRGPRVP